MHANQQEMISTEDIQRLEESCGVPRIRLMERAGKAVFTLLSEKQDLRNKRILIVAYHGNNGGDGLVAAQYLCDDSEVDVLFMGDEQKLTPEAKINYKKIENNDKIQLLALESIDFSDYDIVIDALFGTGIRTGIADPLATLITKLNKTKAFKVSIDVPSGINPDSGEQLNVAFEPDLLITMHDVKKGLSAYADKTVVADIGLTPNTLI